MLTLHQDAFPGVRSVLRTALVNAPAVKTERWQGVAANTDTRELRNVNFEIDLDGSMDVNHWQEEIRPNLPWADDHFMERVSGEPLNPGVQWAKWPWGQNANKFRTTSGQKFNHTYMQRMWPKFANRTEDGTLVVGSEDPVNPRRYPKTDMRPKFGINHHYGDLWDWVELLAKEPYTRQGVIPLFFPEDTGISDGGRKMCSLLYQIIVRDGRAHIWYPLRSCDFVRHWADDCYLAVRLLLWVISKCRAINPAAWSSIVPGTYAMHMTSLHIFESDVEALSKENS